MAKRSVKPVAGVRHVFASGLRFDTEVQYRAMMGTSVHWSRLPMRSHFDGLTEESGPTGCYLSLLQCVSIVTQKPWQEVLPILSAVTLGNLPRNVQSSTRLDGLEAEIALMLDMQDRSACLQAGQIESIRQADLGRWAITLLERGAMGLLAFRYGDEPRWASVVGVECLGKTNRVSALLLLDPLGSEPWGCSHNARLQLNRGRAALCRYLTGEVSAVCLTHLWRVRKPEV